MKRRDGSIEKSARLIVLRDLQEQKQLKGLSLQEIANLFADDPHRSTIMRDLRDLPRIIKLVAEMKNHIKKKRLPTKK